MAASTQPFTASVGVVAVVASRVALAVVLVVVLAVVDVVVAVLDMIVSLSSKGQSLLPPQQHSKRGVSAATMSEHVLAAAGLKKHAEPDMYGASSPPKLNICPAAHCIPACCAANAICSSVLTAARRLALQRTAPHVALQLDLDNAKVHPMKGPDVEVVVVDIDDVVVKDRALVVVLLTVVVVAATVVEDVVVVRGGVVTTSSTAQSPAAPQQHRDRCALLLMKESQLGALMSVKKQRDSLSR